MSFLSNMINEFTHQGGQNSQQGGGYPSQQSYTQHSQYGGGSSSLPPQCPPPWFVEWDYRNGCWLFINRANGERTFQPPFQSSHGYDQGERQGYGQGEHQGYGQGHGQGYGQGEHQGYGQAYGQGYGQGEAYQRQEDAKHNKHNGMKYGAMGAAGGLVAGMVLEHEGEKVKHDWERAEEGFRRDEYRAEERYDDYRDDVRRDKDRVEDSYRREERRIDERIDDFDDRVRYDKDRFEDKVEDIPEDIAYGVGDAIGKVEDFGRDEANAFDAGRDEGRDDW